MMELSKYGIWDRRIKAKSRVSLSLKNMKARLVAWPLNLTTRCCSHPLMMAALACSICESPFCTRWAIALAKIKMPCCSWRTPAKWWLHRVRACWICSPGIGLVTAMIGLLDIPTLLHAWPSTTRILLLRVVKMASWESSLFYLIGSCRLWETLLTRRKDSIFRRSLWVMIGTWLHHAPLMTSWK